MACGTLHQATLALLQNRPRRLTYEILEQELADKYPDLPRITAGWIAQFATCRVMYPCVDKVQPLYEYLSGQTLPIY